MTDSMTKLITIKIYIVKNFKNVLNRDKVLKNMSNSSFDPK